MNADGFWNDQDAAQKVIAEFKLIKAQIDPLEEVMEQLEEAKAVALAAEDKSKDLEAEVLALKQPRGLQVEAPPLGPDGDFRRRVASAFALMDRHGNGFLTRVDVIQTLRADGNEYLHDMLQLPHHIRQEDGTRDEFEQVFQRLGADDSKSISKEEFEAAFLHEHHQDGGERVAAEKQAAQVTEAGACGQKKELEEQGEHEESVVKKIAVLGGTANKPKKVVNRALTKKQKAVATWLQRKRADARQKKEVGQVWARSCQQN